MANIVPFEGGSLPAYIKNAPKTVNNDLTSHGGVGFPVMSIMGKTFALKRAKERKVIMNPLDPSSPATKLDIVIIKANPEKSKVYYKGGYQPGSDSPPDCASSNGITPDSNVKNPVSKSCKTCPMNVIGSKVDGDRKFKACSDSVRIAAASPALVNDPFLIRVPAASISGLGELGRTLDKRGVTYQQVITELRFESEVATPKLLFKPVGFLDEDTYNKVLETAESDLVERIIGTSEFEGSAVAEPEAPAPAPTAETVIAKAKESAAQVAQPAKTVTVAEVTAAVDVAEGKEPPKAQDLFVALDNADWDD